MVGLTHPMLLTPASAEHWWDLHVWLLPVFPLLALGPWLTVRVAAGGRALLVAVAVLGYAYAVCYTALDVLAGVGRHGQAARRG
ncbi:hypothetical protein [Micromonospora sp. NPDC050276]|uniref:hypothetical protein n=1 Tax=Micromonospora sp. NPDC050276 TaxID=3364278 RepID=UPI0037888071